MNDYISSVVYMWRIHYIGQRVCRRSATIIGSHKAREQLLRKGCQIKPVNRSTDQACVHSHFQVDYGAILRHLIPRSVLCLGLDFRLRLYRKDGNRLLLTLEDYEPQPYLLSGYKPCFCFWNSYIYAKGWSLETIHRNLARRKYQFDICQVST